MSELFKDEVMKHWVGNLVFLHYLVDRQPFPGPGLASYVSLSVGYRRTCRAFAASRPIRRYS